MSEKTPSDHELADRLIANGDSAAFHTLYTRHTPALYAFARRLGMNPSDAEDAVHDTWLRASTRLSHFHWQSSLRSWLIGVLINCHRELRRAEHGTVTLEEGEVEGEAGDEPILTLAVDPFDLERAISSMPVGYREVVLLHDVERFTHNEISTLLGIATGTSKSQLARGRRWLRQTLLQNQGDGPDG